MTDDLIHVVDAYAEVFGNGMVRAICGRLTRDLVRGAPTCPDCVRRDAEDAELQMKLTQEREANDGRD